MIVVPLAIMPILVLGMDYIFARSEKRAQAQRFRIALKEAVILEGLARSLEQAGFEVQASNDPRSSVENKELDIGVEVTGLEQSVAVKIYADNSRFESEVARSRIERALDRLKDRRIKAELGRVGVSERVLTPFTVENVNVAPPKKMAGMMLGNFLGYFVVILMLSGGMYPAIDMTAGEKEHRTLEMLLSAPVSREEVVLGKVLATITATFVTAILTIVSFGASFYIGRQGGMKSGMFGEMTELPLDAITLLLMAVSIVPMAVLAAALIIAVAILARSYKEAQSYLTPLIILAIFPAMVSFLPGIKLSVGVALIPVVNFSQLIKEVLLGEWSWLGFSVTLLANLIYAVFAFALAVRIFKNESVLFRT
jgi:sodium transport system permease protein